MDDSAMEKDCRQCGQTPTDMHPKLIYKIQVLGSRLVAKVDKLHVLHDQRTNLVECWMHIQWKYDKLSYYPLSKWFL